MLNFWGLYIETCSLRCLLASQPAEAGLSALTVARQRRVTRKKTMRSNPVKGMEWWSTKPHERWWFQTVFIFTSKIGEDSQFDEHIFQMGGKKTPTTVA